MDKQNKFIHPTDNADFVYGDRDNHEVLTFSTFADHNASDAYEIKSTFSMVFARTAFEF